MSLPMFPLKIHCRKVSIGEASQLETASQLEGIPVPRVVQRTLVKYASHTVVDQVGNLALSGMVDQVADLAKWNLAIVLS